MTVLKASGITATSIAARRQNEEEQPAAGPSGTRNSDNEENVNANTEERDETRLRRKRRGRASVRFMQCCSTPQLIFKKTSAAYDSDDLDGEQEVEPQPVKKRKLTKAAEAKLKAKEKADAKKKKKDEKIDDDEEEDPYRALSRSWGGNSTSPTKPVIGNFEDCAKCKVQFTVVYSVFHPILLSYLNIF